jgi:hypothetical protein
MTAGLNGYLSQFNGRARHDAHRAHLRAVVLLAGSVRPNDLSVAIDRSRLDLPVDESRTVLSLWQDQIEALANAASLARLPMRVVIDQTAPEPTVPSPVGHVHLTVERDARDFRGTGGLLRDLAVAYQPDDLLLVANAAQILIDPLPELATMLFETGSSVSFVGHRDGTPCGLFLVRCAALATIRDIGFLDFKEQVLPKLGHAGHEVRPIMRESATAMPIRTLEGYLDGVRAVARIRQGKPRETDAFGEDWSATFAICEQGAVIDPGATIHDSVVLRGATVQKGAVVVRSVIGPGAVVKTGDIVADEAVGTMRDVPDTPRKVRA